jgi:magnesium chelatase subunit H
MKKKKQENGASFEGSMLKLLRTLPKVLKYLPSDKAQDARSFMLSFQYWLGGSPENLESLLLNLADKCAPNPVRTPATHRQRSCVGPEASGQASDGARGVAATCTRARMF